MIDYVRYPHPLGGENHDVVVWADKDDNTLRGWYVSVENRFDDPREYYDDSGWSMTPGTLNEYFLTEDKIRQDLESLKANQIARFPGVGPDTSPGEWTHHTLGPANRPQGFQPGSVHIVDNPADPFGNMIITEAPVEAAPPDLVNHPPHYKAGGIETIDFIEAKALNYHLGNVVKYITRAELKGSATQDLKKARWYLDREIERREKEEGSDA